VLAGQVDREIAANAATNKHDFLVDLEQAIKRKRHADAVEAEAQAKLEAQAAAEAATAPVAETPAGLRVVG
jgi:hypothetical protein